MSAFDGFYYEKQLTNYLFQFMAIFSNMQVLMGANPDVGKDEPYLVPVPIAAGSKDRVVAWIKGEQTQNKPVRLPALSAAILSFDLAPERRKGIGQIRRRSFMPTGGCFPDDLKVVRQRMPTPWKLGMELAIYASNQDQHYQIIEQIMSIFEPTLQIQTNDETFDWTKITEVELTGFRPEENYPQGASRRVIQQSIDFNVYIHINIPAEVRDEIVRRVNIRVGCVNDLFNAESSSNLVNRIQENLLFFDEVFNEEDLTIDDPLCPEEESPVTD